MIIFKEYFFTPVIWAEFVTNVPTPQEEVSETVRQIQSHDGRPIDVCDLFSVVFTHNVMTLAFGRTYPHGHESVKAASDTLGTIFQMAPSLDLGNFLPKTSTLLTRTGLYGSMEMVRRAKEYSDLIGWVGVQLVYSIGYLTNVWGEKIPVVKK